MLHGRSSCAALEKQRLYFTEYVGLLKQGTIKLLDLLMKFGVTSVDIQGDTRTNVCFCHNLYDGKTLPS